MSKGERTYFSLVLVFTRQVAKLILNIYIVRLLVSLAISFISSLLFFRERIRFYVCRYGTVGGFVGGHPMVCGGFNADSGYHSQCYNYVSEILQLHVKKE